MPTLVEEATQTLNELLRMHQLNQELLYALTEGIIRIRIYAEKHGIPLSDLTMYDLLLEKANALISEIVNDSTPFLQHRKRTPKDSKEPKLHPFKFLNGLECKKPLIIGCGIIP